jgi:hypothetical protein
MEMKEWLYAMKECGGSGSDYLQDITVVSPKLYYTFYY